MLPCSNGFQLVRRYFEEGEDAVGIDAAAVATSPRRSLASFKTASLGGKTGPSCDPKASLKARQGCSENRALKRCEVEGKTRKEVGEDEQTLAGCLSDIKACPASRAQLRRTAVKLKGKVTGPPHTPSPHRLRAHSPIRSIRPFFGPFTGPLVHSLVHWSIHWSIHHSPHRVIIRRVHSRHPVSKVPRTTNVCTVRINHHVHRTHKQPPRAYTYHRDGPMNGHQ